LLFTSVTRSAAYSSLTSKETADCVMKGTVTLEFPEDEKNRFPGAAQILKLCHALDSSERISFEELSSLFADVPFVLVKGF
jgi:hypothetical protein